MRGWGGYPEPCWGSALLPQRLCPVFAAQEERAKEPAKSHGGVCSQLVWMQEGGNQSEVLGLHSEEKGSSEATITQARPAHTLQLNRALPHPSFQSGSAPATNQCRSAS